MHGRVGSPGIFVMSPQIGTMNPAPTDIVISFTTSLKPVGAPFTDASPVNEFDVFAIHIGKLLKPWTNRKMNKRSQYFEIAECGTSGCYLLGVQFDLIFDLSRVLDTAGTVHCRGDFQNFLFDGTVQVVQKAEV